MDHALAEFRKAAGRENRGRRGLQRRYSGALQRQAVEYWQRRRRAGDGMRVVAAALGVAHWSLHRWSHPSKSRSRFRRVQVVTPEPAPVASSVVILLTPNGPRLEGLDVEAAARLLALLR
jgi:hypothetical protein